MKSLYLATHWWPLPGFWQKVIWLFLCTGAAGFSVGAQSSALEGQLRALENEYYHSRAYQAEALQALSSATTALLPKIEQTENAQLRADAYLLCSLLKQRQGDARGALIDISTAVEEVALAGCQLSYLPHLDQLALLLSIQEEAYAYPIELRERIRRCLEAVPSARRVAKYEDVTIRNLIRLADLRDRTGKPHRADTLLGEAEQLLEAYPLKTENRFQVKLFRVHRLYYKNALKTAEREARDLLVEFAQAKGSPRERALARRLYARILIGLGRVAEAETLLLAAAATLEDCCSGLAYEREEIARDLALCYQTLGKHEAARTLLAQWAEPPTEHIDHLHARYADYYGDLASSYYAEYREGGASDQALLLTALAHDRRARYHHYTHLHRPLQPFDRQWTVGVREQDKRRSVAILGTLYNLSGEEEYFYEAFELLEEGASAMGRSALHRKGYAPIPWKDSRARLRDYFAQAEQRGKTLVRYVVDHEHIYLLAWNKNGIVFLPRPLGRLGLEAKLKRLHRAIVRSPNQAAATDLQMTASLAHELYTLLLAPVEELAGDRLLIMPDEALSTLPFNLLLSAPVPLGKPLREWPFAVHRFSFSYANSLYAETTRRARPTTPVKSEILAFAPEFEPGFLRTDSSRSTGGMLRNTEEVAYLVGNFPCRAFVGEDATLDRFYDLASEYAVLHLATHAAADVRDGERGYLTFSAAQSPNKITAEALLGFPVAADLVVLSACDTGLGEWQAGGAGVVGLESAFLDSGAASVVSTYWKVSDRASAQFMPYFYDRLAEGLPKDVALQNAQVRFLTEREAWLAHPFFWAGYGLKGATDPIRFGEDGGCSVRWVIGLFLLAVITFFAGRKKR